MAMKKFETEVRLSREMTLMDATLIGVGAMIGAGIFTPITFKLYKTKQVHSENKINEH
jgi:hypothetical protein